MKKYIIIIWISLTALSSQAQQCFERNDTTTLDNWNWRTPTWEVYVAGYFNPPVNLVTSPFYEVNNFNTYGLTQFETQKA